MTSGTCFGFAIESALPFQYLRGGPGDRLDIRVECRRGVGPGDVLTREWRPRPDWSARLYRSGDAFRVSIADAGWFEVDPAAARIAVPDGAESAVRREERVWGIPALLCFLRRRDVPLHAAVIEIGGEALLIAGPSGAGKTTLAAALVAAGHRLLSEDLACLRLGERVTVIPGPAMLRLRHDVADRVPVAGHVVGHDCDRVHVALPADDRGSCAPVPVRGVVLIHGAAPRVEIDRMPPARALPDLWALSFNLPDPGDRERCFGAVAELARRLPVWSLRRPVRYEAMTDTIAALEQLPATSGRRELSQAALGALGPQTQQ